MAFRDDYREYEAWLRTQCDVVEEDLRYKRQLMKENPFVFLRATAFRWARRIGRVCPELAGAPAVLSVVDLHMENFGTWRDAEGRLIWGVNDFDEAAEAPYVFDLVRLAASARLVPGLRIARPAIAAAILDGYRRGLEAPRPTLLDEQETWMRPLVACSDRQRAKFWDEVHAYPDALPPPAVAAGLRASLPADAVLERLASCRKGGGSLGRPRYVAIAAWRGGHVVREAKALVPSAWDWAHGDRAVAPRFAELADGAFRTPDPFLRVEDRFIYRRIAANSRKVNYDGGGRVPAALLTAMGRDLGAIHAADPHLPELRADLAGRPAKKGRTTPPRRPRRRWWRITKAGREAGLAEEVLQHAARHQHGQHEPDQLHGCGESETRPFSSAASVWSPRKRSSHPGRSPVPAAPGLLSRPGYPFFELSSPRRVYMSGGSVRTASPVSKGRAVPVRPAALSGQLLGY